MCGRSARTTAELVVVKNLDQYSEETLFVCVFSKLLSDAVSVNGGDVRVGGIYRHAVY